MEIVADRELEQPAAATGAVSAFSGGVDSCFTVFRHATGRAGRQAQTLRAGMIVHGFEIALDDGAGFEGAAAKAEAMLADLGLDLVRMATNVRDFSQNWRYARGAGVSACLMLLQPNARTGLVPSTEPYDLLVAPWGSHPLTDPHLSSASFQIVHDGAGWTRPDKIGEIGEWPQALEFLRVCFLAEPRDGNCGTCEKCIRTILGFRAAGLGLPPCFARDVTNTQIRSLGRLGPIEEAELRQILDAAERAGIRDSWVRAVTSVLYRNRRKDFLGLIGNHVRRRARAAAGGFRTA